MIDLHESEYYVHNLLLIEPDYAPAVLRTIPPEWFDPGFSQDCIREAAARVADGKPVDYLSVLTKTGLGYKYSKLVLDDFKEVVLDMSGRVEDLEEYKSAMRTSWLLRELPIAVHNRLSSLAEDGDPFEIMDEISSVFEKFRGSVGGDIPGVNDIYDEFLAHQKTLAEMNQTVDMFHRLPSLNKIISNPPGMGRFGVIAGSTSHGKSSFISPMLLNCIEHKIPCYLHSAEMSERNALQKLIQYKTGLSSSFFEQGGLGHYPEIAKQVTSLIKDINSSDALIIEKTSKELSLPHVRKTIRVLKETKGVQLFILDRAELFKEFIRAQQGGDKVGALTAMAAELRTISTILGVTIILFAQSTNEATKASKGRTTIGTIYGGRSLPASADFILGIYNPVQEGVLSLKKDYGGPFVNEDTRGEMFLNDVKYNVHKIEVTVLKDTYGGKGAALLGFIPESQMFIDLGKGISFSNKIPVALEARAFKAGPLIPDQAKVLEAFSSGAFTTVPGEFDGVDDDFDLAGF